MNYFDEMRNIETAIIPKGTIINGNIQIDGRLEMYGIINGDIESNDCVNVCGEVNGNITASDLNARDSFIEGKIDCTSSAYIRENTIVLGDLNAHDLTINGAIQGKLDVRGCITMEDNAIVDCDIKAKSVQISTGAAINGHCSLCYADVNMDELFPKTEKAKVEKISTKEKSRRNAS